MTEEQKAREMVDWLMRRSRRRAWMRDVGTLGLALIPWAIIAAIASWAVRAAW